MKQKSILVLLALILLMTIVGCTKKDKYDANYGEESGLVGSEGGTTEYVSEPTVVESLAWTFATDTMPVSYTFSKTETGWVVSQTGMGIIEDEIPVEPEVFLAFADWVDCYNIRSWDGFAMADTNVMDGDGFSLYILLGTGETISVSGSNAYPNGYREAKAELETLMDDAYTRAQDAYFAEQAERDQNVTMDGYMSDFAEDTWQTAYRNILTEYEADPDTYGFDLNYAILDMDGDATPELMLKHGTCEADYLLDLYQFDGSNAMLIGSVSAGHSAFYRVDRNSGLYRRQWHMGTFADYLVTVTEGEVVEELIAEGEFDSGEPEILNQLEEGEELRPALTDLGERITLWPAGYSIPMLIWDEIPATCGEDPLSDDELERDINGILAGELPIYAVHDGRFEGAMTYQEAVTRKETMDTSFDHIKIEDQELLDLNGDGQKEIILLLTNDVDDTNLITFISYQNGRYYAYIGAKYTSGESSIQEGCVVHKGPYGEHVFRVYFYLNEYVSPDDYE